MQPAHSGAAVWRYRGLKMLGVLNRPAGRGRFPAVLFLHGFPGAEKSVDLQRWLMARGVASFAPHFSGAWGSAGRYRISALPDQAAAALRFMKGRDFVDPRRVAVYGFSIGGWAALNQSARAAGLRAVAAVSPVGGPEMLGPGTRSHVARLSRPLMAAPGLHKDFVSAVTRQDPAAAAARRTSPLLLVHGDRDEVVSFAVSTRILAAARAPKALVRARGGAHDFLDRRDWLCRRVGGWLLGRLRG